MICSYSSKTCITHVLVTFVSKFSHKFVMAPMGVSITSNISPIANTVKIISMSHFGTEFE